MTHSKNAICSAVLFMVFSLWFSGCSSSQKNTEGTFPYGESDLSDATKQEAAEFVAVERLYKQQQWDAVVKRTKSFISHHPKSKILDQIYFVRGLAYLGLKQHSFALINFKYVISLTDREIIRNMALYNKAFIESEDAQYEDARSTLEAVRLSALAEQDRSKFFILLAKIEQKRNNAPAAVRAVLFALRYTDASPMNAAQGNSMQSFLEEQLAKMESLPAIEKLIEEFSDLPLADHLHFRAARIAASGGDSERAKAHYESIESNYPNSRYLSVAKEALAKSTPKIFDGKSNPSKIGVLLTLSGKFGKYGYKTLQGIQLALGIFGPKGEKSDGEGLNLVIFDDGGDEERAARGVEELVKRHEVIAIIGPLLSKVGDAAAKKAEELGVPLIALTQKEAVGSEYVFNAALTPAMQIRELVRASKEIADIKNYAILAPSSRFGEEYSKTFWDELTRKEYGLRGFESYPANETDFRSYVDNLVGLAYPDARGPELEQLEQLKQASQLKISSKRLDKMFALKPFVDFEAIFIPDDPKSLGQILPTFAYKDVDKMLFLGINTWNSPDLISRAGRYAEGAIFVDAFFPGSTLPSAKLFAESFRMTFDGTPSSLEAISFDAAKIVAHILRSGANSRSSVREKLADLRGFSGIMGDISYIDGKLTKRLAVLTVKGGKIEEIASH